VPSNVRSPDLAWYKAESARLGLPPRCPFASVERCPRFFASLGLLGEGGFATKIDAAEDKRLEAAWQKSDLWPRTDEQKPIIMGWSEDPKHFLNFCPEVLFDRFGLFATGLNGYADEVDQGGAHARLREQNASRSDWRWTWAYVAPMHYTDCPVYSPLASGGPGEAFTSSTIMANDRNDLDPFRVVVGSIGDSDLLVRIATAAGLRADLSLNERDSVSHKTRVRALLPRILAAYDGLPDDSRLTAARAAIAEIRKAAAVSDDALAESLGRAGWELRDSEFVVKSPETREVFFPKGSPWDAFVVLRDVFAEAKSSITVIDAYSDATIFKMLAQRSLDKLHVRILCSTGAEAVAAEAKVFSAQHPSVTFEVRRTKDFHDRFIVLDDKTCVHVGASIKDAGKTAFMVSRVEDERNRDALLKQSAESWKDATPVA
jgi:hypothetical protein